MVTPQQMATRQDKIGETASFTKLVSPSASYPLDEPRAPISILTPAKRAALIACLMKIEVSGVPTLTANDFSVGDKGRRGPEPILGHRDSGLC